MRLDAKQKFDLVMTALMRGQSNRLIDGAFGADGLKILNDFEEENHYEITKPGSWTNQAGLEYVPLGLIGQDKDGYFFTGVTSESVDWSLGKLQKGLNLKWIAKNFPSLSPMIEDVWESRQLAHSSIVEHLYPRQPEFFGPAGILVGIQKAHIVDAQLLGGRTGETIIDSYLTTATAHASHSFFASNNFMDSKITASLQASGDIILRTDVVHPNIYHPDCVREDVLLGHAMTPFESTGIMKMVGLRTALQQTRNSILEKWMDAHAEKKVAA